MNKYKFLKSLMDYIESTLFNASKSLAYVTKSSLCD